MRDPGPALAEQPRCLRRRLHKKKDKSRPKTPVSLCPVMRTMGNPYEVLKEIEKSHCLWAQKWVSSDAAARVFTHRLRLTAPNGTRQMSHCCVPRESAAPPGWTRLRGGCSGGLVFARIGVCGRFHSALFGLGKGFVVSLTN